MNVAERARLLEQGRRGVQNGVLGFPEGIGLASQFLLFFQYGVLGLAKVVGFFPEFSQFARHFQEIFCQQLASGGGLKFFVIAQGVEKVVGIIDGSGRAAVSSLNYRPLTYWVDKDD